jgi:hypothetical protein
VCQYQDGGDVDQTEKEPERIEREEKAVIEEKIKRKERMGSTYPNGVIATLTRLSPRTFRR